MGLSKKGDKYPQWVISKYKSQYNYLRCYPSGVKGLPLPAMGSRVFAGYLKGFYSMGIDLG